MSAEEEEDQLVDEASFDELVEIERATALIQERDPGLAEAVVAARLTSKAEREKRDEQVEKLRLVGVAAGRKKRRRIALIVVVVIALGAASWPIYQKVSDEIARSEALRVALTTAAEGAVQYGFKAEQDWLHVEGGRVSWSIPKGTCSAIVAVREGSADGVPVRVERQKGKGIERSGKHVWCSCDTERVTAHVPAADHGRVALRWLTMSVASAGGVEVLAATGPEDFKVRVDEIGLSCADSSFQIWSGKGKNGALPELPPDQAGQVRALTADGLEATSLFAKDRKFGVIPVDQGQCALALPTGKEGTVSLRAQDGKRLVANSSAPLAWCAYGKDERYSLWRDEGAASDYVVMSADAKKLGGMAGLRALTARQGLGKLGAVVPGGHYVDDAVAALMASTVAESDASRWANQSLSAKSNHRVVAFSMLHSGSFVSSESSSTPMGCHPRPDPDATMNAFVCVQARPQKWRAEGQGQAQGAASAKLPFWLTVLAELEDPGAMQAAAQLLGFARRMGAAGYEPSTSFGIEDTQWGAKISGHANKKQVVAVGMTKTKPWVQPLSHKKEEWTLDGAIGTIEVEPDGVIELRAKLPLGYDKSARRVVVWRR